jgi:hypothetical protein
MLARFTNDDGRLTVLRLKPEPKILRRQAPGNVGIQSHLNSWRDDDGNWNDELEKGPLSNLDTVGKSELDEVVRFGIEADAEAHLRLLNISVEQRAVLQLFIAALMVRTTGFREQFDEAALPTLLSYMRQRLKEEFAAGHTDQEIYEIVLKVLGNPGGVRITPPPHRHLNLLLPLIEKVAYRLHLDTLVGVRRLSEPLLLTGSEPVVVFPTADVATGCSSGKLFSKGDSPVEPWQEREELLKQVDARLQNIAGLAVAVDPHTLLLMFHADREDGAKLAFIASQLQPEALAGLTNIVVTGGSSWLAGRDDCKLLALSIEALARSRGEPSSAAPR